MVPIASVFLLSLLINSFKTTASAKDYDFDEWGRVDTKIEKYQTLIFKLGAVAEFSEKEAAIMAGLSSGISISRNSLFNVGLNFEKYSNAIFMPTYLGLRTFTPDISRARAYLFIEAGYAIGFISGVSGPDQGGPFAVAGFGVGTKFSDKILFSGEFGFKYHHHQHTKINDRKEIIVGITISNFSSRSD